MSGNPGRRLGVVRGKDESEGGRVFEGSDTVSELSKAICAIEYKTKDEELPLEAASRGFLSSEASWNVV